MISILEADYGRTDRFKCQFMNNSKLLCSFLDVTEVVQKNCNDKRRCRFEVDSKTLGEVCQYMSKYLQVKYECKPIPKSKTPCDTNPCGLGAICKNVNDEAVCSCPEGKIGNPEVRCCKQLTCG